MASITLTENDVTLVAGSLPAFIQQVVFGENIARGEVVYLDSGDSNHAKLADASDTAKDTVAGIAITNGGDGDIGYICTGGPMNIGATTALTGYWLAPAPGEITATPGDLGTGNAVVGLGFGTNTGGEFYVCIANSSDVKA